MDNKQTTESGKKTQNSLRAVIGVSRKFGRIGVGVAVVAFVISEAASIWVDRIERKRLTMLNNTKK